MEEGLFEIVLSKVQDFFRERDIQIVSEKTLMAALPLVIECVETVKNKGVTGEEKKDLAIRVVIFLVQEAKLDDDKKKLLQALIEDGALETTIDVIIAASRGEFELNRKTKRKLLVCMSECLQKAAGHFHSLNNRANEVGANEVEEVEKVEEVGKTPKITKSVMV